MYIGLKRSSVISETKIGGLKRSAAFQNGLAASSEGLVNVKYIYEARSSEHTFKISDDFSVVVEYCDLR